MFMAVHAGVGALAGNLLQQPAASFAFGVISHFFLDMIPHGDEVIYQGYVTGTKVRRSQLYVALDAFLTTAVIAAVFLGGELTSVVGVAAGIIGGLLPDLLVGLSLAWRPKRQRGWAWQLKRFQSLHRKNHTLLIGQLRSWRNGDIPFLPGLAVQLATIFVIVKFVT